VDGVAELVLLEADLVLHDPGMRILSAVWLESDRGWAVLATNLPQSLLRPVPWPNASR